VVYKITQKNEGIMTFWEAIFGDGIFANETFGNRVLGEFPEKNPIKD
jgi:hypothetical protein